MIQGLSYAKGIFYFSPDKGIAHAWWDGRAVRTRFFAWDWEGIAFLVARVMGTLPWYLWAVSVAFLLLIWRADAPLYGFGLIAFGYHFAFPRRLKLFHGAEHKVFSFRGRIHLSSLNLIREANVVNRGCSTNLALLYCAFFLAVAPFLGGWVATGAALVAVVAMPRWQWGMRKWVFPASAWLQKHVTTAEPEELHLRVAVLAYMSYQAGEALDEAVEQAKLDAEMKAFAESI